MFIYYYNYKTNISKSTTVDTIANQHLVIQTFHHFSNDFRISTFQTAWFRIPYIHTQYPFVSINNFQNGMHFCEMRREGIQEKLMIL